MKAFLARVFGVAYDLHLVTPLIIFFIIETLWGLHAGELTDPLTWRGWKTYWGSWERLRGLVPVYATFIVVLLVLVRKEAATQITDIGPLDDALEGAESYFAVSPTPFREWFDPASQAYLTRVIGHRMAHSAFHHERVQLFLRSSDLEAVQATYLDEHPAKCFMAWHHNLSVHLAYLTPDDILDSLRALTPEARELICGMACPWLPRIRFRFAWLLTSRLKLWSLRRSKALAFAFVRCQNEQHRIVRFEKDARRLAIYLLEDARTVAAYVSLAREIERRIRVPGGTGTRNARDLRKYLGLM